MQDSTQSLAAVFGAATVAVCVTVTAAAAIPVVPVCSTRMLPLTDPDVPTVRNTRMISTTNGIDDPLVAAVTVKVAMLVSPVVPAVPRRIVKVDTFAAVDVHVPASVIRYVVPGLIPLLPAGAVTSTVSVVLMAELAATMALPGSGPPMLLPTVKTSVADAVAPLKKAPPVPVPFPFSRRSLCWTMKRVLAPATMLTAHFCGVVEMSVPTSPIRLCRMWKSVMPAATSIPSAA